MKSYMDSKETIKLEELYPMKRHQIYEYLKCLDRDFNIFSYSHFSGINKKGIFELNKV